MVHDPDLLGNVFRPFLPQLGKPLPFSTDDPLPDSSRPFLTFEWIGTEKYLNEHSWGTRGANCTSTDFAFRFRRYDGRIQLVLGEWKYTEEYAKAPRLASKTLTTQKSIYLEPFECWKASGADLPTYDGLFVEPFYQLMRQTLLAQAMERARERGNGEMQADIVSLVHVSPAANRGLAENFKAAPELARFGKTVGDAWKQVAPKNRFLPVSTESLLTIIDQVAPERLQSWREWLLKRHGWWGTGIADKPAP
ncbi:MAG: hypothetical protein HYX94_05590 [Chloroflexi bacterium]|nr:hypothetical protein [Chloroflexota bacterium]